MLFDSIDFKAMESSLTALSIKQQVISQNIANQETPDYKQKEVSFSNVLEDAIKNEDNGDGEGQEYSFQATVTEDDSTTINVDGNNVDSDKQSVELYATYLQHAALVNQMNSTFNQLRTVANANFN